MSSVHVMIIIIPLILTGNEPTLNLELKNMDNMDNFGFISMSDRFVVLFHLWATNGIYWFDSSDNKWYLSGNSFPFLNNTTKMGNIIKTNKSNNIIIESVKDKMYFKFSINVLYVIVEHRNHCTCSCTLQRVWEHYQLGCFK